jgi:hypothetical protein
MAKEFLFFNQEIAFINLPKKNNLALDPKGSTKKLLN